MKKTKIRSRTINVKLIIFDVDGVLIDVSQSYRLAIKKTAEFFLGKILQMSEVDEIKSMGVNNDYDASELLIQKYGKSFKKSSIIKKFQEYYLGKNFNGLIRNEKLLINEKTLRKLSKKYKLAIFTGRPREEAFFVLERFRISKYFDIVISMEDVNRKKPSAEGLYKILKRLRVSPSSAVYVGDSIADVRAANNAGIDFIGVIPPNANGVIVRNIFKRNGVNRIVKNINGIATML